MTRLDLQFPFSPLALNSDFTVLKLLPSLSLCNIQLLYIQRVFHQPQKLAQFDFKEPPATPPCPKCPNSKSTLCTFSFEQVLKGKSEMDFWATLDMGTSRAEGYTTMKKNKADTNFIFLCLQKVKGKPLLTTLVKSSNTPGYYQSFGTEI